MVIAGDNNKPTVAVMNDDLNWPFGMGLLLTDDDKLIIIIVAGTLILLTLLVTICLVSPCCFLYRFLAKSKLNYNKSATSNNNHNGLAHSSNHAKSSTNKLPLLNFNTNSESQHFHLSIVPVYGTKNHNSNHCTSPKSSSLDQHLIFDQPQPKFEHLTSLAEKARLRNVLSHYEQQQQNGIVNQNKNSAEQIILPKIEGQFYYEPNSDTTVKICMNIKRVFGLSIREETSIEPSPYVVATLTGFRVLRKGIIIKASQNELFRTETVKRCLEATFTECFVSEELPKNLIKEANIKLRLMDEQRFANDVCLAELNIPLKKFTLKPNYKDNNKKKKQNYQESKLDSGSIQNKIEDDNDEEEHIPCIIYNMLPVKEIKGELLAGFCYLPTSRRVNITIVKGNIKQSLLRTAAYNGSTNNHQAFFIKALMFCNGKLIKKKKTASSIRLSWGKNETISFDMPDEANENVSLMLILAYKIQNSNSPDSPETPENPTASSGKNSIPNEHSNNNSGQTSANNNSTSSQAASKNSHHFNARKDFCIGHFILDKQTWNEDILKKPRNQILKWYKLY